MTCNDICSDICNDVCNDMQAAFKAVLAFGDTASEVKSPGYTHLDSVDARPEILARVIHQLVKQQHFPILVSTPSEHEVRGVTDGSAEESRASREQKEGGNDEDQDDDMDAVVVRTSEQVASRDGFDALLCVLVGRKPKDLEAYRLIRARGLVFNLDPGRAPAYYGIFPTERDVLQAVGQTKPSQTTPFHVTLIFVGGSLKQNERALAEMTGRGLEIGQKVSFELTGLSEHEAGLALEVGLEPHLMFDEPSKKKAPPHITLTTHAKFKPVQVGQLMLPDNTVAFAPPRKMSGWLLPYF